MWKCNQQMELIVRTEIIHGRFVNFPKGGEKHVGSIDFWIP